MLLDRIFGMIAAAAFALGAIDHVELLNGPPEGFRPMALAMPSLLIVSLLYLFSQVGKREGLENSQDEGLAILPMIMRLPGWAIAVSVVLLTYAAMLLFLNWTGYGFQPPFAAGSKPSQAVSLWLAINALFTALAFVMAAFCLVRTKSAVDD